MQAERAQSKSAQETFDVMVANLAGKLHDLWREPRRIEDRKPDQPEFEPRIKSVSGIDFDIANLCYAELPEKFQAENKAAATGALREISLLIREFGLDKLSSIEAIEALSDVVHKQWMERNGSWAPKDQMVPYGELVEAEKEKDRVIARAAVTTYLTETVD